MEHSFIGIDVAKDQLDVHVRPTGEVFRVTSDDAGLGTLLTRLRVLSPTVIALEATGGYEVPVAAALASAACRWRSSIPARFAISPARLANWPRPIRSTRG